tara:strand:- start:2867 stop:3028 length:162 start_codon:yes stop_codon:yes gene_type:complete
MIQQYILTYLTKDDRQILTNHLAKSKAHAIEQCMELNPSADRVLLCVRADEWS